MQNNNGSRVIPTTVFLLYRKLLVSYKESTFHLEGGYYED